MARTDDDSWDITESVGATALGVAAARAAESRSDKPLFDDPCAQIFVDAAVARGWSSPFTAADPGPAQATRIRMVSAYAAARTKWFDEFFASAGADGIRQVVILAAGLDARAWRLPWPDGTVVFEIDQPKVLAFKEETLAAHGIQPVARHVAVPVDLRQDWPEALRQNDFDPTQPTAWLAEGLLPYLPAEAQDLLFDRLHELSAPGSRVAVEGFGANYFSEENQRIRKARMDAIREEAAKAGQQVTDVSELFYPEPREDVAEWLARHGWQTRVETSVEVTARYKPEVAGEVPDIGSEFVDAKLV
ncbi:MULTISPECIES: class I SAM-dependent methyltransferase [unclassified Mycobacterium]|uniref:class I SAM-dependent methyltransferase n=1 Tax=unclassified Mycobacterium TaxID=2642494 RepID=UPI00055C6A2C|nr:MULTISPECIES: class I SAM-dependent methyltransferase [unclassified Mycobacterium]SEB23336.1 methyltransferase, TIGR00027 family [Mycobacterium sp. 283mftsu]